MNTRPLSIVHLVFGLIFLGVTALWVVGVATDADSADIARLVPAVLIGAGVIGLGATLVNARRPHRSTDELAGVPTHDSEPGDTAVLDHEEQR